ncbi:MAG: signal peptidase I [Lachnospira sp.]|nr:signal peptidase I [Lachnospira sp.]
MGLYLRRYQENTKLQDTCRFAADILLIIIAAFAIVHFTCDKFVVSGSSMTPVLESDNSVLVNRWSYSLFKPKRYDVIAFANDENSSTVYIKRIIGLPGENVQIKDKKVYINGNLLEDDVITQEILTAGLASQEIKLDAGEYFVLGDNRNNSEDSRFAGVGLVEDKDILGNVWFITGPAERIGFVK